MATAGAPAPSRSHSTVKHHLANARSKVGAETTAQLVWILAPRLPEPWIPMIPFWTLLPLPPVAARDLRVQPDVGIWLLSDGS